MEANKTVSSPRQSQELTLQHAISFRAVQGSWVSPDHPVISYSESSISYHALLLCAPYALCHTLFHSNNLNIKTGKMSSSLYWLCSLRSIWGRHSSDSSALQIRLKVEKRRKDSQNSGPHPGSSPIACILKEKGKRWRNLEYLYNLHGNFSAIALAQRSSELGSVSISLKGSRSTI